MAEYHPEIARHNELTSKLTFFLQGIAASAVAFALHETSDRPPGTSLIVIGAAIASWAASFAGGIVSTQSNQVAARAGVALDLIDAGRGPTAKKPEAKRQWDKYIRRSIWAHRVLVWGLLLGAVLYATGHTMHTFTPMAGRSVTPRSPLHAHPVAHRPQADRRSTEGRTSPCDRPSPFRSRRSVRGQVGSAAWAFRRR